MFNKATGKIVRYCRPTQVDEKGVLVSAFFLRKKNLELNRPKDEKTRSVYLESTKEPPLVLFRIFWK